PERRTPRHRRRQQARRPDRRAGPGRPQALRRRRARLNPPPEPRHRVPQEDLRAASRAGTSQGQRHLRAAGHSPPVREHAILTSGTAVPRLGGILSCKIRAPMRTLLLFLLSACVFIGAYLIVAWVMPDPDGPPQRTTQVVPIAPREADQLI